MSVGGINAQSHGLLRHAGILGQFLGFPPQAIASGKKGYVNVKLLEYFIVINGNLISHEKLINV